MAAQFAIMTMEERRSFLLGLIEIEENICYIKTCLDQDDGKLAICLLELAIPCILHYKNRCGEKILHLFLSEALASFSDKSLAEQMQFVT